MNPDRVLESFLEMVAIESPSWHEAPMAAWCAEKLADMGFSVFFDASAAETGSDTGNLIAHLPGTVPGRIAFSAHLDTVKPCAGIQAVIEQRHICDDVTCRMAEVVCSVGDTILSADDKAGIAAIFEGVRATLESGAVRPDITVLLTTCEEQSLLGSSALAEDALVWPSELPAASWGTEYEELLTAAGEGGALPLFVLDADGAPGTIIMGAPYHWTLRARIEGRAAHAGVEPECGVSAIQVASAAVAAMPLGRIDECTTANIGRIEGGVAVNIVPAAVTVEGECRSLYEDRVLAQRDAMTAALQSAAAQFGGAVEVAWELDYPAVVHEPADAIVQHLAAAARAVGLEPRHAISGGGADANVLGTKGADAITLGIGMTNFHSVDEYIEVADLRNMARYVEAIIAEYA
ncbi:M20/M25/M40 family metallo-hydrolase [Adlercreutzia sp. R7]|uniref:M20/M25/M40 family metallo-hydrolase n=1 Tax=Adlercreutzia wanghongyangiae TaxID=3111451 RepID=A0ABU6IK24_9ACTN|nr:M20/M25/M40 family metallo-hydrolase [Adlercreutzia sp. R7]